MAVCLSFRILAIAPSVEVAMETTIPRVTKCAAISLQLHLAKGISKSVGLLQAIAVTCAFTIA
ncbi:MAG: hypothetical protein ICV85_14790 [Tolypothrix sp. T3-bin4]|nr:hypothetical protein [Tolypothrix sp. T3-bin4]